VRKLLFLLFLFPSTVLADLTFSGNGSGSANISGSGTGKLTIPLSSAAPVENGEIGNTSVTDLNTRSVDTFFYSSYSVTTAGQVTYCHARIDPGISTDDFTIGIYQTDGTLLAYTNVTDVGTTTVGWYGGALNTAVTLEAGTKYIIGVVANQNIQVSKDGSEAGHYRRRFAMTYSTTLANTSFASYTSDSESTAHNFQCDNTADTP
jgi:hypothetical protein